jgi:hypothetical protein
LTKTFILDSRNEGIEESPLGKRSKRGEFAGRIQIKKGGGGAPKSPKKASVAESEDEGEAELVSEFTFRLDQEWTSFL